MNESGRRKIFFYGIRGNKEKTVPYWGLRSEPSSNGIAFPFFHCLWFLVWWYECLYNASPSQSISSTPISTPADQTVTSLPIPLLLHSPSSLLFLLLLTVMTDNNLLRRTPHRDLWRSFYYLDRWCGDRSKGWAKRRRGEWAWREIWAGSVWVHGIWASRGVGLCFRLAHVRSRSIWRLIVKVMHCIGTHIITQEIISSRRRGMQFLKWENMLIKWQQIIILLEDKS